MTNFLNECDRSRKIEKDYPRDWRCVRGVLLADHNEQAFPARRMGEFKYGVPRPFAPKVPASSSLPFKL